MPRATWPRLPRRPRDAMLTGADVIYQAALVDGNWRGFADFLERVDRPSPVLGAFSYEVLDTKLARHTKPYFLIQLCVYSDLLERLQGVRPEHMHVVLGSGERVSYRVDEFFAYYTRLKARYGEQLLKDFAGSYPEPVSHCGLCRWSGHCDQVRLADDHLSLVAGIARSQRVRLGGAGHHDRRRARRRPGRRPPAPHRRRRRSSACANRRACRSTSARPAADLRTARTAGRPRVRAAARTQPRRPVLRHGGRPVLRRRPGVPLRGHADRGRRAGVPRVLGPRPRRGETRPSRTFIDFVMAALADDPDLHVYHYAAYEQTAIKKLMGRHGTREDEVDHLLRSRRVRRPLPGRAPGAADLQAELLDQEGRGVLHATARRGRHRRRRLDRAVRAVADQPRPADPAGHRGLQRSRLSLHGQAPPLAA